MWSLLTSIISVAWSFQANYARRKFDQMSILSRGIYFLYVLLAVICRLISMIIGLLSFGKDTFFAIYVIGVHMLAIILLDIGFNFKRYKGNNWFWTLRDCLLKAFSSIYLYHPIEDSEMEDPRMHLSVDVIILIQFVTFTGIIQIKNPNSGWLLVTLWSLYISAMLLKIAFYLKFHPWAEVLMDDLKKGRFFRGSICNQGAIEDGYDEKGINLKYINFKQDQDQSSHEIFTKTSNQGFLTVSISFKK